jgi:hypothetical protein
VLLRKHQKMCVNTRFNPRSVGWGLAGLPPSNFRQDNRHTMTDSNNSGEQATGPHTGFNPHPPFLADEFSSKSQQKNKEDKKTALVGGF